MGAAIALRLPECWADAVTSRGPLRHLPPDASYYLGHFAKYAVKGFAWSGGLAAIVNNVAHDYLSGARFPDALRLALLTSLIAGLVGGPSSLHRGQPYVTPHTSPRSHPLPRRIGG